MGVYNNQGGYLLSTLLEDLFPCQSKLNLAQRGRGVIIHTTTHGHTGQKEGGWQAAAPPDCWANMASQQYSFDRRVNVLYTLKCTAMYIIVSIYYMIKWCMYTY